MQDLQLNDFIADILQDFCETESMIKILRESMYNENSEVGMSDVRNALEIIIAKVSGMKYSLNKYIDMAFDREAK